MGKSVWKYGGLSGLAIAASMGIMVPLMHRVPAGASMAITYTLMVLSFLIVFVGVKHYRDAECGGVIGFGRAFGVGVLMMLISCLCYVLMWEALMATVERNFGHDYAASMVKRAQSEGLQGEALEKRVAAAHAFEVQYANPVYRMSMTLLEPLPVGIVMALVTAGILKRKRMEGLGSEALAGLSSLREEL